MEYGVHLFKKIALSVEKIEVIITAGGSGLRLGSNLPKQFIALNECPILIRTVALFAALPIPVAISVVLPPLYVDFWNQLILDYNIQIPHTVVVGGLTRFHSVRNALAQIGGHKQRAESDKQAAGITMVHDGVRPLVSKEMILGMLEVAKTHPATIPVVEINDSMRLVEGAGGAESVPVDRSQYRLVQTPQIFWTSILREAYRQSYLPSFTDDASVVEHLGIPLYFTKGDVRNIKITTPEDFALAELLVPPFVRGAVLNPDLALNGLVEGDQGLGLHHRGDVLNGID